MSISRRFVTSLLTSPAWWVGVLASLLLSMVASQLINDNIETEFEYQTSSAEIAIRDRLKSYVDVLRSLSAFFHANDGATREQFQTYVRSLEIEQSFPGIGNLNFAPEVFADEKLAFELRVRKENSRISPDYPVFSINPPGERNSYHPLTFQEPMQSNFSTWGLDLASIPKVKKALDISRDTGELSTSGRLIKITGENPRVALAMRLPLYHRGMPLNTVQQRRAAYYGTVGAGFNISKLLLGALDNKVLRYMRIRLYDTGRIDEQREIGTANPDRLLFDTAAERTTLWQPRTAFKKRVPIEFGARIWEIEFEADKSAMSNTLDTVLPWSVLCFGLLASLLLYGNYYSLISARRRAIDIASDMTKDLRASETSLAEAQHMARLGSWLMDTVTHRMSWSDETFRLFGLQKFLDISYEDFLRRIHPDDREQIRKGIDKSIGNGVEFEAEHRILRGDGSLRWVQTIARPGRSRSGILVRGTLMDVTERKVTVEALKRSQQMLRDLTSYQNQVKEDERKRIAREIHDELGQTLLALRIDVAMLDTRTAKTHPRLNAKVRAVLGLIDSTMKTIRTIINNLRPSVLDLGLTAAIEWQVAEFQRRSGIACELHIDDRADLAVDDTRATTLFRVLQESLTNVIRHAAATKVEIELSRNEGQLAMKIADNGIGIYPNNRRKNNSFGLLGVEERIHALHGECTITSEPGKGTTLIILIPIAEEQTMLN